MNSATTLYPTLVCTQTKKVELRTLSFYTWRPSEPVHYHIFQAFVVAMAVDLQRGRFPQQF